MNLTRKSDVKSHLSPHHRKGIHLYRPVSKLNPTGFATEEAEHPETEPGDMVDEPETSATERESASSDVDALAVSKNSERQFR
jgi:hypothetical protein